MTKHKTYHNKYITKTDFCQQAFTLILSQIVKMSAFIQSEIGNLFGIDTIKERL